MIQSSIYRHYKSYTGYHGYRHHSEFRRLSQSTIRFLVPCQGTHCGTESLLFQWVLLQHLYNICTTFLLTTFVQHLYKCCTTSDLYNICATSVQHLYNICTTFVQHMSGPFLILRTRARTNRHVSTSRLTYQTIPANRIAVGHKNGIRRTRTHYSGEVARPAFPFPYVEACDTPNKRRISLQANSTWEQSLTQHKTPVAFKRGQFWKI